MTGPKRIVCLTEETTELLYLLGEQERIVGITTYTVRPPEAKLEKPIVTAFISGNVQKIKALNPDLIIGFSDIQADFSAKLIREGLNVLITNQRSLGEIFETMQLIGNLIGKNHQTEKLIDSWKLKIDEAQKKNTKARTPTVFFQEWDDPIITGIRWVSELIEIAGGQDCFQELRDAGLAKDRIVTAAQVRNKNPEIIIGSWCGKPVDFNWVNNHPDWKSTPAVKEGRTYEIPSSVILQPGPALFIDGLDQLAKIIHPS